jgi:hypothetical protein
MQKSRFLFKKAAFMRNKKPRKIKSRGHVTAKMRQGSAGRLRDVVMSSGDELGS